VFADQTGKGCPSESCGLADHGVWTISAGDRMLADLVEGNLKRLIGRKIPCQWLYFTVK
jgi:hypothetical protein